MPRFTDPQHAANIDGLWTINYEKILSPHLTDHLSRRGETDLPAAMADALVMVHKYSVPEILADLWERSFFTPLRMKMRGWHEELREAFGINELKVNPADLFVHLSLFAASYGLFATDRVIADRQPTAYNVLCYGFRMTWHELTQLNAPTITNLLDNHGRFEEKLAQEKDKDCFRTAYLKTFTIYFDRELNKPERRIDFTAFSAEEWQEGRAFIIRHLGEETGKKICESVEKKLGISFYYHLLDDEKAPNQKAAEAVLFLHFLQSEKVFSDIISTSLRRFHDPVAAADRIWLATKLLDLHTFCTERGIHGEQIDPLLARVQKEVVPSVDDSAPDVRVTKSGLRVVTGGQPMIWRPGQ